MTPGIGHNSGRDEAPGRAWRTHVWRKARANLMPKLPIEVIRRRVARAKELGLPYKTYAGLRAASGDDLIGFMFSSNALHVVRAQTDVPAARAAKLASLRHARTVGLAQRPVTPDQICPPTQCALDAPQPLISWARTRDDLRAICIAAKVRPDRMVLVCDTALEREWVGAAKLAGALTPEAFFTP